MSNIYQDPHDLKRSHLAQMIRIAKADETVEKEEIMFIHTLSHVMGINPIEFEKIAGNPDSIRLEIPSAVIERFNYFYQLLVLVNIDLNWDEREAAIIRELGIRYGFDAESIEAVLAYLKEHQRQQLDKEAIQSILF